MNTKKINNIHDKTIKAILSNIKVARSFFEAHLPKELEEKIDWSSLRLTKGSFVDRHLSSYFTDLLYEVRIKEKTGYFYLLIEGQTTPDRFMPFRLLKYIINIMEHSLDRQQCKPSLKKLPMIYPIVYYHGKQAPYPYSIDLIDYFDHPDLARKYFLKPAKLIDLSQYSNEELRSHKLVAGLELVQKHIFARDLNLVMEEMLKHKVFIDVHEHSSKYFEVLLKYIVNRGELKNPEVFLDKLMEQLPDEEKEIMTIAQYLKQQGRKEGKHEGKEEALLSVAKKLLAKGQSLQLIREITGFSESELSALK